MMATGFDLFGVFLLVIMSVSGLKKGLIDGVLKIVGMYAAMYVSMNYSEYGLLIIEPLISIPDAYKTIAGFASVFLVVMYSVTLLGYILKKIVKIMNLGIVDRIGGITFGAAKAGLLLSAVVWALAMIPEDMRGTWQQDSKLYPGVEIFADNVVKIFALEDEMAMMQSTVGSIMGGDGESGSMSPDILKLLGGSEGEDQMGVLKNAMESMSSSQKQGLLEQVMGSMGVGGVGGEDSSNVDRLQQIQNAVNAGSTRQNDMEKMLEKIEAEAQGRK